MREKWVRGKYTRKRGRRIIRTKEEDDGDGRRGTPYGRKCGAVLLSPREDGDSVVIPERVLPTRAGASVAVVGGPATTLVSHQTAASASTATMRPIWNDEEFRAQKDDGFVGSKTPGWSCQDHRLRSDEDQIF